MRPWWIDAVIYQVYLRSFQDTDGDGLGDLDGVTARLDYLVALGVDALWLTPFHPSPLLDGGYDVADFLGVDPRFGDLAAFDRLVVEAHGRGLRLIIDFVPNHTSDQHPWFVESRSSADSPKRNWYIWCDGREGGPPSNWGSMLGGPAWQQDAATGQYYYHAFLPEQPDLNWRNPEVRVAMADVLAFWLERGVDGVRVDAVPHLVEDDLLRDDLPEAIEAGSLTVQAGLRHVYTSNRPETLGCMAALRRIAERYSDRVLIGETHLPMPLVMRYVDGPDPAMHAALNFTLLETDWEARALAASIDLYLGLLPPGASPNWVLGNHDEVRVASRLGPAQARVAAMLAFTLGGAVFVYNGDELGLEDVPFGPGDLEGVPEMRHPEHALEYSPHRTPMPWDSTPQAGFTAGAPWLPIGGENVARHVAAQEEDPGSMLALYRRLIELRRCAPALAHGRYEPRTVQGQVLSHARRTKAERMIVALNLGHPAAEVHLPGPGEAVLSTYLDREGPCEASVTLRPSEGVVFRIVQDS